MPKCKITVNDGKYSGLYVHSDMSLPISPKDLCDKKSSGFFKIKKRVIQQFKSQPEFSTVADKINLASNLSKDQIFCLSPNGCFLFGMIGNNSTKYYLDINIISRIKEGRDGASQYFNGADINYTYSLIELYHRGNTFENSYEVDKIKFKSIIKNTGANDTTQENIHLSKYISRHEHEKNLNYWRLLHGVINKRIDTSEFKNEIEKIGFNEDTLLGIIGSLILKRQGPYGNFLKLLKIDKNKDFCEKTANNGISDCRVMEILAIKLMTNDINSVYVTADKDLVISWAFLRDAFTLSYDEVKEKVADFVYAT